MRLPLPFSRALSIALAVCPPASIASAQASGATPLRIAGTVLNTVTGKPVGHALVSSADNRLATLSDDEGHFSFELRPPGNAAGQPAAQAYGRQYAQLRAQKPGYLADNNYAVVATTPIPEGESGSSGFASAGPVPIEQPAGEVLLHLTPAATLTGTVSADTTDTAREVPVILLKHQVVDGERTWVQLNRTLTDSQGGFRFAGLDAGDYAVMSGEWTGEDPQPSRPETVSREYPPVFAGDMPRLTPGAVLHLAPGATARIDLHLRAANYYPVTIPLGEGQGRVGVEVSAADSLAEFSLGVDPREHAVTGALPDGDYVVHLSGGGRRGPRPGDDYAEVPLHVDGAPVRTAPVTLLTPGGIPVHVHRQFTQAHDGNGTVNVLLRPAGSGRVFAGNSGHAGNLDEFSIDDVVPGAYLVTVNSYPGYAAAITSGGTDLLREHLVVGPGGAADPIEITLRDETGTISGSVTADGGPPPTPTFLYLVPTTADGHFLQGFAGPRHTFALNNVPPGSYRLFASASPRQQIAWRDPDSAEALRNRGVGVTVTPGGTVQQDVAIEGP